MFLNILALRFQNHECKELNLETKVLGRPIRWKWDAAAKNNFCGPMRICNDLRMAKGYRKLPQVTAQGRKALRNTARVRSGGGAICLLASRSATRATCGEMNEIGDARAK